MQIHNRWMIAIAAAVLPLAGCNGGSATAMKVEPPNAAAAAKQGPGGVMQITLKDIETKHLGIEFAVVTNTGDRLTMPYNALLYDPLGGEWAFSSSEANVYVRTPLKVEAIEGETVFLAKGPPAGTKLVTSGATELYGIEFGVSK